MKKLAIVVVSMIVLLALVGVGCSNKLLLDEPPVEGEVASSCVTCHTDKETLQAVAAEVEEVSSEATSGEG